MMMTSERLPRELERILALPERVATQWEPERVDGGTMQLRPVQAEALGELRAVGAGLVSAGTGHGKTLIGLLSGAALGTDRVVYVAPAACVAQVVAACNAARLSWVFPEVVVLSWGRLSLADGEAALAEAAGPGTFALVLDEAHVLRSSTTARTKRVLRFRAANAGRSRMVLMSGTLTRRQLLDLSDVAWLALGERSPVPTGSTAAALASYVEDPAMGRGAYEARILCRWAGTDDVVQALGRRVQTAPGVVTTSSQSVDLPLYVVPVTRMPEAKPLVRLADEVARTFRVPDGEDLVTPADVARACRQLALGYHLMWVWHGEPDRGWIEARREWAAAARRLCADPSLRLDTELAASQHVEELAGQGGSSRLIDVWLEWQAVKQDPARWPVGKPVWHTVRVVEAMVDLAYRQRSALLWYDDLAVSALLASFGVPLAPHATAPDPGQPVAAVSVRSHGTGLDLQRWSRNVMLSVPSSGAVWEQLLGRTHRPGNAADEVVVWRPAWAGIQNAAWRQAVDDAQYIEKMTGQQQKLALCQEVSDVSEW